MKKEFAIKLPNGEHKLGVTFSAGLTFGRCDKQDEQTLSNENGRIYVEKPDAQTQKARVILPLVGAGILVVGTMLATRHQCVKRFKNKQQRISLQ